MSKIPLSKILLLLDIIPDSPDSPFEVKLISDFISLDESSRLLLLDEFSVINVSSSAITDEVVNTCLALNNYSKKYHLYITFSGELTKDLEKQLMSGLELFASHDSVIDISFPLLTTFSVFDNYPPKPTNLPSCEVISMFTLRQWYFTMPRVKTLEICVEHGNAMETVKEFSQTLHKLKLNVPKVELCGLKFPLLQSLECTNVKLTNCEFADLKHATLVDSSLTGVKFDNLLYFNYQIGNYGPYEMSNIEFGSSLKSVSLDTVAGNVTFKDILFQPNCVKNLVLKMTDEHIENLFTNCPYMSFGKVNNLTVQGDCNRDLSNFTTQQWSNVTNAFFTGINSSTVFPKLDVFPKLESLELVCSKKGDARCTGKIPVTRLDNLRSMNTDIEMWSILDCKKLSKAFPVLESLRILDVEDVDLDNISYDIPPTVKTLTVEPFALELMRSLKNKVTLLESVETLTFTRAKKVLSEDSLEILATMNFPSLRSLIFDNVSLDSTFTLHASKLEKLSLQMGYNSTLYTMGHWDLPSLSTLEVHNVPLDKVLKKIVCPLKYLYVDGTETFLKNTSLLASFKNTLEKVVLGSEDHESEVLELSPKVRNLPEKAWLVIIEEANNKYKFWDTTAVDYDDEWL